MPCYSRIQTKLSDLEAIKASAAEAGMTVEVHSKRSVTVVHNGTRMELYRYSNDQEAFTATATSTKQTSMLATLTKGYATARVKTFAKKRGYMVARGTKPGEFVLTKYG